MQLGKRLSHRQTYARTACGGVHGCVETEERLEYLVAHFGRYDIAVVLHYKREPLVVGT